MAKRKVPPRDLTLNPYTEEEKIQMALDQFSNSQRRELHLIPEPTYQYEIGEEVIVGALHHCRVHQILEGGKVLLIKYRDKGKRYGTPYDYGDAFRVWMWVEVEPMKTIKTTALAKRTAWNSFLQSGLTQVIHWKYHRGYWTDPTYQRGYVWTMDDKIRLLDSIFNGYDIGKFVFVEHPFPENRLEVLDGKQRLDAIIGYTENRYPYKGYYWYDLSLTDRSIVETLMVQYVILDGERLSVADRLEIFLMLNRGGVPQTDEHIAHVRKMYEEERRKEDERKLNQPEGK